MTGLPRGPEPLPFLVRWACRRRGLVTNDLLSLRGDRLALDPGGVADLLAWGAPLGARSMLAGVARLRSPWRPAPPSPWPGSLDPGRRAERLWELLVGAAAAAGPGRITLSGGLDSRAVAAAAVEAGVALDAATFGDVDAADLPAARAVAEALGIAHRSHVLDPESALRHEARVWRASGGVGGPASAPGAETDTLWSDAPRILSGGSADVIWGDTPLPPPASPRRLRRLGVRCAPSDPQAVSPPPPTWVPEGSRGAWVNLWTRQAASTWAGSASRRTTTPVLPLALHPPLLSFCLALSSEDRRGRALLRRALSCGAPRVAGLPTASGRVHDLDRAMRGEAWARELDRWIGDAQGLERVGLRAREVRRLVRTQRRGRDRAGILSRLRALWRWGGVGAWPS